MARAAVLGVLGSVLALGSVEPLSAESVTPEEVAAAEEAPAEAPPTESALASHAEEVEAWRTERHDRLSHSDGWLTLAGLFWLVPGDNAVGSDAKSEVILPEPAPASLGKIRLGEGASAEEGRLEFIAAEGRSVVVDGQVVEQIWLRTDMEGAATRLQSGPITFFVLERGERLGVRVKNSQSPVLTSFTGIDNYPISWHWRIRARYVANERPRTISIPTAIGTVSEEPSPGRVEIERDGQVHFIDVLHGSEENEIWLVFGDRTNGKTTYAAGRFLYATLESGGVDTSGEVWLDFNRAYNPPCAFTPYATCPLPPPRNRIDLAVEAGEKSYGDPH